MNDQQIRERMRQIKKNRDAFLKDPNRGIILISSAFMSIVDKYANSQSKYLWSDNPGCAYFGILDIDGDETYYCPIEDCTEEEIRKIDSLKYNIQKNVPK